MQGAISINQTNEMQAHSLQLVVPKMIHCTYTKQQQAWLITVDDFLTLLRNSQSKTHLL